jgi:heme oxygenase
MTIEATRIDEEPSSQRATRKDILTRLKIETAAEHSAIEDAARIMHPRLTVAEYRGYLEKSYGYYAAVEALLWRLGVWEALDLPAVERIKLPLLADDLVALGVSPSAVIICDAPPRLAAVAEGVGAAYVLEGSTLGGKVISRHVRHRLGEGVPRSFLDCYGESIGSNWQSFRGALSRFAKSRGLEDAIVSGAKETFQTFTRWLAQSPRH